jgi:hypothetical protein
MTEDDQASARELSNARSAVAQALFGQVTVSVVTA